MKARVLQLVGNGRVTALFRAIPPGEFQPPQGGVAYRATAMPRAPRARARTVELDERRALEEKGASRLSPALLLCDAASNGDVGLLRRLAKDHKVSVGDYDRRTALHIAASEGHSGACLELLHSQRFTSVNTLDNHKKTIQQSLNHSICIPSTYGIPKRCPVSCEGQIQVVLLFWNRRGEKY